MAVCGVCVRVCGRRWGVRRGWKGQVQPARETGGQRSGGSDTSSGLGGSVWGGQSLDRQLGGRVPVLG